MTGSSVAATVCDTAPSPPPSPPPPSPPPPPTCGNGAFDSAVGEQCEPYGNSLNPTQAVRGCDPTTCEPEDNWRCADTNLIGTGEYNCTCSNELGTYAVADDNCEPTPCPFPDRCLAFGRGCIPGAGGNACDACLTAADVANLGLDTNLNKAGYYKAGQICTVCPGTSAAQLFIAAAVVVILAFCGFKASQVMGAQATNNMKKIIESLQFFSLSLNMSIEWPGPVLNIGKYLEGFTFSIEFLRPECVATGLNWFNIFLASVFVVPGLVLIVVVVNDRRGKYRYNKTVKAIHSEPIDDGDTDGDEEKTRRVMYWIERPGYLWGKRRTFQSEGGDKIVKELQKQYRFRASLRGFGVLSMTVLYLPIVRMCLQSFDCIKIDGKPGTRLEHDIDIKCEDRAHSVTQGTAAFMLFVVGVGLPAYVIRQVYKIRVAGKLDDPRTLDSYGAFYDIYRRDELSQSDKLEIAQISRDALARKTGDGEDDDDETAAAKAIANEVEIVEDQTDVDKGEDTDVSEDIEIRRSTGTRAADKPSWNDRRAQKRLFTKSPSAKARERAEKMPWKDRFSLYYLAIELIQKSSVILATSPLVTEQTKLSGWALVFVHWFIGIFVVVCQPWRIMTLGLGQWKISNCLNKVEAMAAFLQGFAPFLAMVFPVERDENGEVQENLTFDVITMMLTVIITGLLSIRVLVFVFERLAVRRKKMDLEREPEKTVMNMQQAMIKSAKKGAVVSLYAMKTDFDIQRRKTRARLEDTRQAMLLRIDDLKEQQVTRQGGVDGSASNFDDRISALYEVANEMARIVNLIVTSPPPGDMTVNERLDEIENYLSRLLSEEEARFLAMITDDRDTDGVESATHAALVVHAYDRAIARLDDEMRRYAAAELIADLIVFGSKYEDLKSRQRQVSMGFGEAALIAAETAVDSEDVIATLYRACEAEDAKTAVEGLTRSNEVATTYARRCEAQKDFFRALKTLSTEMRDAKIQEDAKKARSSGMLQKLTSLTRSMTRGSKRRTSHVWPETVPREPPLTTDGAFDDILTALFEQEKQFGHFLAQCVSTWASTFTNFGRLKYTRAFAELTDKQLPLDVGRTTSAAEETSIFNSIADLSREYVRWCDDSMQTFVSPAVEDAGFASRYGVIVAVATKSLASVRASAEAHVSRTVNAHDAVNRLVELQNEAKNARQNLEERFETSKQDAEGALAARVEAIERESADRLRALEEQRVENEEKKRELEEAARMNIEWFRLELNDVERELTSREVDKETRNRLVAKRKSIKNALRDEETSLRKACADLDKRLQESERAVKRANERAQADARRDEALTRKRILQEQAAVRKLDETEITARDAMTTARKEVHRHKRAVEIVASTESTVASAVRTAAGRLAVASPVNRRRRFIGRFARPRPSSTKDNGDHDDDDSRPRKRWN